MKKYLEYFDGAFDSTVAEKVKPENKPYVAYSPTEGVIFTIIPTDEKYTILIARKKDIPHKQYELVDLGLSVKWATCNIGGEVPSDTGAYFEWGRLDAVLLDGSMTLTRPELIEMLNLHGISVTDETLEGTLDLYKQIGFDILGNVIITNHEFSSKNWDQVSNKYPNNGDILQPQDDAASFYSDGQLRMPTKAELEELLTLERVFIDVNGNYIQNPTTSDSIIGIEFKSVNGNNLFVPYKQQAATFIIPKSNTCSSLWSSEKYFESGDNYSIQGAWLLQVSVDKAEFKPLGPAVGAGVRGVQA